MLGLPERLLPGCLFCYVNLSQFGFPGWLLPSTPHHSPRVPHWPPFPSPAFSPPPGKTVGFGIMLVFAFATFDGVEAMNAPARTHANALLDSLLPTVTLNPPVLLWVHVGRHRAGQRQYYRTVLGTQYLRLPPFLLIWSW